MKLQYIPFAGQQLHLQWPHRAQAHCGQDTDCPFPKAFRALFSILFAENIVPLTVQNGHNLKNRLLVLSQIQENYVPLPIHVQLIIREQ